MAMTIDRKMKFHDGVHQNHVTGPVLQLEEELGMEFSYVPQVKAIMHPCARIQVTLSKPQNICLSQTLLPWFLAVVFYHAIREVLFIAASSRWCGLGRTGGEDPRQQFRYRRCPRRSW